MINGLISEVLHWLVRRTYIHVFSYIRSPESRGLISEFLTLDGPEDLCTLTFFINKNTVIIWLNSEVLHWMIQRTNIRISHIHIRSTVIKGLISKVLHWMVKTHEELHIFSETVYGALWLQGLFPISYIRWPREPTLIFFLCMDPCDYRVKLHIIL